ncbi:Mechanosensitive ion channel [Ruegeria lacuscaerulensis ITI-1157]|nr:Mechanosensitive ion channel [Ruegeria lacuscaerulensis ITI-1157]
MLPSSAQSFGRIRRIRRRTLSVVRRCLRDVEEATAKSVQAEAIAALIRNALSFVLLVIFFLGFYYYLSFVLLAFAKTRYFAHLLLTYLTEPVLLIFRGIISYVLNLIMLALIAWLTILVRAMLSLGANSVVSNMLAGLFVIYRRSISIGDHIGDVAQIKLREPI